jgi:hypothetical protein
MLDLQRSGRAVTGSTRVIHGQYLSTVARLAPGAGGHHICRIIACYAGIAITLPVGSISIMILSTLHR